MSAAQRLADIINKEAEVGWAFVPTNLLALVIGEYVELQLTILSERKARDDLLKEMSSVCDEMKAAIG
jgi:hypothetical protein